MICWDQLAQQSNTVVATFDQCDWHQIVSYLQCGYLYQGTWKKIIQSQCFKNIRSSFFLQIDQNHSSIQQCNRWKILNHLNFPDLSGNCPLLSLVNFDSKFCLARGRNSNLKMIAVFCTMSYFTKHSTRLNQRWFLLQWLPSFPTVVGSALAK